MLLVMVPKIPPDVKVKEHRPLFKSPVVKSPDIDERPIVAH